MTEALAKIEAQESALARAEDFLGVGVELLKQRVAKIREVRDYVMKDGAHFGKIPGVDKPTLLKPGAEILCMAFQLAPELDFSERWDGEHLEVVVKCALIHVPTGNRVGTGIGSCSTRESRYAYRKSERVCPECSAPALLKSKHDPEWFCWAKRGGCGAKFPIDDERITKQVTGRVANPDLPDQYNTVRKMAAKRAHVAATLSATGASELFTQDVEDLDQTPRTQQAPANGNGRNGRTQDGKRQATDDDVYQLLALIDEAPTLDDLEAIRSGAKQIKFTAAQSKQLSAAVLARQNQLNDPDYVGDDSVGGAL
jgi:hypothetical protein